MVKVEQSKYVKQVIEGLKSDSTKGQYLTYLNRYVNEFLKGKSTVEDLVEEAKTDVRKTQQSLDKFYEWLQAEKELKESSAYIVAFGYVRGFFANLDIHFQRQWSKGHAKAEHTKEAIKQDNIVDFFPLDEKTKTITFNRDLMQRFLDNLKLRDEAITLCLLSSAQDSGDLFRLNIGDINKHTNNRIFWEGKRGKTGVTFRTFFSKEATKFVRRYVEQERKGAKDEEPLFTYTSHNGAGEIPQRMIPRYLSEIYRGAASKMGITWKKRDQNPLRPKRMRHLFRTACDTVGLNELYINCFMGHKNHMGQSYSEIAKSKLELEYLKVEPFITVYGEVEEGIETREEVAKLKTTIGVLTTQLKQIEGRMSKYEEFTQKFMEMSPEELAEIGKAVEKKRQVRIVQEHEEAMQPDST